MREIVLWKYCIEKRVSNSLCKILQYFFRFWSEIWLQYNFFQFIIIICKNVLKPAIEKEFEWWIMCNIYFSYWSNQTDTDRLTLEMHRQLTSFVFHAFFWSYFYFLCLCFDCVVFLFIQWWPEETSHWWNITSKSPKTKQVRFSVN